jgi:prepilin-type N-terminal cleavage/methylation domain-containing protein
MKRNNKKGFTIVELVIVIAVIAILAGVLIPTFAGIVSNAKESAVLQEASAEYKEAYALAIADGKIDAEDEAIKVEGGKYTFKFTGSLEKVSCEVTDSVADGFTVSVANGAVKVEKN